MTDKNNGRSPRIKDVAARAGVSVGTVSNVLNDLPSVTPENYDRVRKAVEELGFVRSDIAHQLRRGMSKSVALVVLSTYNAFYSALAEACAVAVERFGATLILGSSAQSREREGRYIAVFEEQRVRGLLLVPVGEIPDRAAEMHERGTPVVIFDGHADLERYCSVSLDSEASGYLAISHLAQTGRVRLMVVGGPAAQIYDRLAGARRATEELGLQLDFLETGDMTIDIGADAADAIARIPIARRPTGIFAANDLIAAGLASRFSGTHHIRVPQDIAIVGHDDIDVGRLMTVPLTTVRQPIQEMADAAVRLIQEEADSTSPHSHVRLTFAPELVVRTSA